jgi:hypothetical protein
MVKRTAKMRQRTGLTPGRSRVALTIGVAAIGVSALAVVPAVASADPPTGRAYELVSPADDPSAALAGISTEAYPMPGRSSADGDALVYGASSVVGSSWSGPANTMIFGRRTATGWTGRSAVRSLDQGDTPMQLSAHDVRAGWLTNDGQQLVFGTRFLGGAPLPPAFFTYNAVYRSPDADEAPTWLSSPPDGQPTGGELLPTSVAAADDTKTVAFSSSAPVTADAPPAGTSAAYVQRDGALELVSRLPDGSLPTETASLANSGGGSHNPASQPSRAMRNQLADNGRFVLFALGRIAATAPLAGVPLYVRDLETGTTRQLAGGGTGAPVNAVELRTGWGGANQNAALGANSLTNGVVYGASDAPRAYFKGLRLDSAVPAFLYEADLETGAVTARTAITGPPLGLSADGDHMLFLAPPATGTGAGAWTLRYWDRSNPGTSVALGSVSATSANPTYGHTRVFRSSADGKTWTFTSIGNLDPARPNVSATSHQLYRWTVGESTPTCLSCQPTDGVSRLAGVNLTVQESFNSERFSAPTVAFGGAANINNLMLAQPGRSLSDDGRWLLFDSPDRLIAEDTNNVRDVYLWDRDAAPGDELQIVTSGQGNTPSYALDLDASGDNVFFSTREGLVPADDDGAYDVYVARVGGGFPDSPASCVGEECRPPVIPALMPGPVGSGALTGVTVGPKVGVQAGTPKLRVRALRTSTRSVRVRIDTPSPGQIRVSGKSLRTTSRTAKRATTYTVQVPLSAAARRSVARGKTVRVGVRVQFTPQGSNKASRITSSVSVKKGR